MYDTNSAKSPTVNRPSLIERADSSKRTAEPSCADKRRKDTVGQLGSAPRFVQRAQVRHDALLGVSHFDRQRCAEHVTQQARHIADRLLGDLAKRDDARVGDPHQDDDHHNGRQDCQRQNGIDARQHDHREPRHNDLADRVEHPAQAQRHRLNVVAQSADRFA